jgi:hypothetical protein
VVTMSSSDIEEALELLSLSPSLLGIRVSMLRSSRQALMLVVTCVSIGPKPLIWP